MHRFNAPARIDELMRQPVEKLRMARRFGANAEIAGRAHKARAEMSKPNPIDHHARGQRIFFRRDCLGKFKTPAAVLEGLAIWTSDDLRKLPRDFVAETGWISTN